MIRYDEKYIESIRRSEFADWNEKIERYLRYYFKLVNRVDATILRIWYLSRILIPIVQCMSIGQLIETFSFPRPTFIRWISIGQ